MVHTMWRIWQEAFLGLGAWLLPLAVVLAALLLGLLALSWIDRERVRGWLAGLSGASGRARQWLWPVLALGLGVVALQLSARSLDSRLATQLSAHTRNSADPDGQPTTQAAPSAALLEPHTYSRTLTLPRDLYTRLDVSGGWEALTPYLQGNESPNVQDIRDDFITRGKTLYYTRQVTMLQERPIALDSSQVDSKLQFGGNNSVYNAQFAANYTFTNPEDHTMTARFQFPLPEGSGTLSNFKMTLNGKEYRAADLQNGSYWQGELAPHATVHVAVSYKHQGSRGWSYLLSQRREPIRQFSLKVSADRPARFGRYSLYPTHTSSSLFGASTLDWNLQDVITAQNVSVLFSQGSLREMLGKIHLFMPLALLLSALLSVLYAQRRALPLESRALAWALLSLTLGYGVGGVLTAYLPPLLAEPLGAVLGLALALRALGRPFLPPFLLAAVSPLVFLSGTHAGLLLSVLAVLGVLLLSPSRLGPPRA